jgi:hypothetical protein
MIGVHLSAICRRSGRRVPCNGIYVRRATHAVRMPEAMPGQWYLGVRCAECEEMVLVMTDASRGIGPIRFEAATPEGEVIRERCVAGHWNVFRLDAMRRFQWYPRVRT